VVRQDGAVIRELRMRLGLLLWAVALVPLSGVSLVLAILTIVGVPLVAVWAGLPLLVLAIVGTRQVAKVYRRFAGGLLGIEMPSPYLQTRGSLTSRARRLLTDPATRRDALWVLVNGTIGLGLAIIAVVECVLDLLFWWLPPALSVRLLAHIAGWLLRPTESSMLAQRVEQLTESRAETVDSQAAELRRIERDLHDGAQARLVSLGMSLGMAEELLERDPDAARELLAEARSSSAVALGELRDLVRGIHPPVLADRGLGGAVEALALAAPIPVRVDAVLPSALPPPAESAAYFALAEALTNVIKHSGAKQALIEVRYAEGVLHLRVSDDGRGGADPARGSGLAGIRRRLSAFDGRLIVSSPTGGPTVLTMELPCASSSPRILPSSGTA
jgi:signal transduction histidine kinase